MAGDADVVALPVPCLVVLVGASGSGKSTWAAAHFEPDEIVSSDRLRAVVGRGEDDLEATADAFAVLEAVVAARLRRGLTTVVDTLGLDPDRRRRYRELAADHGVACVAVGFAVSAEECRARNRERPRPLPAAALDQQLSRWNENRPRLDEEGFAQVLAPVPVRHVPARLASAAPLSAEQRARPVGMRFGLHLSAFGWDDIEAGMSAAATAAEAAAFDSVWLMDHMRQIPQVGRDWDPMLECYTALAWLAARTSTVGLGALVTPVTFRNVAHLAKIIATLDVLSGGGPGAGSASAGTSASTWPTAGTSPIATTATPCWPTRCRRCPSCGGRGPGPSWARGCTSPRPSATHGRARPTCPSSWAGAARSGRCAWPPATPTP